MVLDGVGGERTDGQLVFICRSRTRNNCTFQVSIAKGCDIKAFITCCNAALLINTGVIAAALLFALADAGTAGSRADGHTDADTGVALFGLAGGNVLQALDVQITAYGYGDLFATGICTDEVGVISGFECKCFSCIDLSVVVGGAVAVGIAFASTGGYAYA